MAGAGQQGVALDVDYRLDFDVGPDRVLDSFTHHLDIGFRRTCGRLRSLKQPGPSADSNPCRGRTKTVIVEYRSRRWLAPLYERYANAQEVGKSRRDCMSL